MIFPSKVSEIPTGYINNLNPATPINGKKLLKLIHLAIQNWKAITYDASCVTQPKEFIKKRFSLMNSILLH